MVKLKITDHSTPELVDTKQNDTPVIDQKDSLEQLFEETEAANEESSVSVDDKFAMAKEMENDASKSKKISLPKLPNVLSKLKAVSLPKMTNLTSRLSFLKLTSLTALFHKISQKRSATVNPADAGSDIEQSNSVAESIETGVVGKANKFKIPKLPGFPKLPKRKPKLDASATYITALDVGTEFVKAMIAQVRGDNIEIIGVGRAHQGLADMQSGAISDIAAVVENCEKALAEAEDMAGVQAKKVVVGIAGELVKGTTLSLGFRRRDQAAPITSEEMEKVVAAVHEKAYEQARSTLKIETGSPDVDVRLVNSAIVSILVDGYKVTNPIGFQGSIVKVQLYTAFAPLVHIGALERTVKELDLDLLAVAAEPFAVARAVVGNDATSQFSAILIDVGGGTTDIAIVDDGGVEGTKMFGIGGRSFTRKLSQDLGVTFERAESLKLHANELPKTPTGNQKIVSESIDNTLEVWKQGVELALSEFHKLEHLPSQIMLCGGGASLNKLFDSLSSDEWYKELPFTKKPTVSRISPKETVSFSDLTGEAHDHTFITAMGLLRVGADTLGPEGQEPDQGSSIKRKLDTIMSN
jgi:cell division protein FtsA